MADEGLKAARRKGKAKLHLQESPFPVPIATWTQKPSAANFWYYYFGKLKSDHVCVSRLGDLTFLYRFGYFGKGILSRSRPQFEKYNDVLADDGKQRRSGEENQEKLLRHFEKQKERLRQHKCWNELSDSPVKHEEQEPSPQQCEDFRTDIDDNLREELSSEEDAELESKKKKKQSSVLLEDLEDYQAKKAKLEDEYKLYEHLQLAFEEAFFLSYGLGCLSVSNDEERALNLIEMWTEYCARKPNFAQSYTAYHHFRSKGWVVRVSNLYGSDFLLYKDGMPFYHASYSVVVRCVDEDLVETTQTTWKDLSCMTRVTERNAKELLICYVIKPRDVDTSKISCVKEFKIFENVFRRWIPKKHR